MHREEVLANLSRVVPRATPGALAPSGVAGALGTRRFLSHSNLESTRNEQALLCQLLRGVALRRVGQTSFLVEHELCAEELALAGTDGAMR